jgi:hypothetical protein
LTQEYLSTKPFRTQSAGSLGISGKFEAVSGKLTAFIRSGIN